jgi:hypothetical protein
MDTIVDIFIYGIQGLLNAFLNSALTVCDVKLNDLADTAFNIQNQLTSNIGLDFNSFYNATSLFGFYFIVLKFLLKGFNIYVLWNEGDADLDPFILLIGFMKAIVVTICFNFIFDYIIEIPLEMITFVTNSINTIDIRGLSISEMISVFTVKLSMVNVIFVFMYITLFFQFIKRGFEIYALKIGIPLASAGLMDSDGGVFKPLTKKFLQEILSVLVQILFLKISIALMINGNLLFGLAGMGATLKAPQFLQEFIMMYGGGGQGLVSKTTQTIYMANMVRSFVK